MNEEANQSPLKHGYKFEKDINIILQTSFRLIPFLDDYLDNLNTYSFISIDFNNPMLNIFKNYEIPVKKNQEEIILEFDVSTQNYKIVEDFVKTKKQIKLFKKENKISVIDSTEKIQKILKKLSISLLKSQIDGVFKTSSNTKLEDLVNLALNNKDLISEKLFLNNQNNKESIIFIETKNSKNFKKALAQIESRKKHFYENSCEKNIYNFIFSIFLNAQLSQEDIKYIDEEAKKFHDSCEASLIVISAYNKNEFLSYKMNLDVNSQRSDKIQEDISNELKKFSDNISLKFDYLEKRITSFENQRYYSFCGGVFVNIIMLFAILLFCKYFNLGVNK